MPLEPVPPPILDPLLRYWQERRASLPLPPRSAIDPIEMGGPMLPYLLLTDLLDRGTRVRFRLVGTAVVKRLGFDPTGRYLDADLAGAWGTFFGTLHRLLYAERAPIRAESEVEWGEGRRMQIAHLLLPLTQDGPDPAIALVGLHFATREAFPRTLAVDARTWRHTELNRAILKSLPVIERPRIIGRDVA
ncbi:MAG TPA: PAS domain-containing protein [Stellaceae bacterium]|nr:PAS domain-containing protein [Stellaceae bacterium]